MTGCRRGLVVLVVGLLVSPGLAATVGGAQATGSQFGDSTAATAGTSVDVFSQENNSTRHVHPDEVNDRGDLQNVESWLAGRMGERLARSSVQLSEGEYELARQFVGEEYRQQYGQYVEVAGETATDRDDEAADAFESARDEQEELVEQVRTYRETREEYEEAKESGDEERTRRLARDLQRQADAINETSDSLLGEYTAISNDTDTDMREGSAAVEEIQQNVSEQVVEVRGEEFVATDLSLSVASDTISFTEPLEATGRLVTANGTAVADRHVQFRISEQRVTTRTDDEGRFSLTYRPRTIPVGEQPLTVRYVPENTSVYLGSEERVSVTVEQVQPEVELASRFDTLAFDDRLIVNGSVAADGVGAAGVPVVATLGDERIGQATAGPDGSFTIEGRVPATVEPGERELSVRVPLEDRALASARTSTAVQVETTETRLSLAETAFESGEVRVTGELATSDGQPVPDRPITVTLDGTTIGTVRTGGDGTFDSWLDVPARLGPDSGNVSLELVASFEGEGTNLENSRDSTSVEVTALGAADGEGPGGEGPGWFQFTPSQVALLGGLVVLVTAGGAFVRRRRGGDSAGDPDLPAGAAARDTTPNVGPDAMPGQTVPEPAPLDAATRLLDEGATDAAVETAYAAVRSEIGAALDVAGARTHWEFLEASRAAGLNGDGCEALEVMTEGYERAAFAPRSVTVAEADSAIDAAHTVTASRSWDD